MHRTRSPFRLLFPLLVLLTLACRRTAPLPREESDVACTLTSLTPLQGSESDPSTWIARFRIVNRAPGAMEYRGFAPASPIFREEVLREDRWEDVPLRYCGTGLVDQRLDAGGVLEVEFALPADGRFHRFRFGEPAAVTPPVSAPR